MTNIGFMIVCLLALFSSASGLRAVANDATGNHPPAGTTTQDLITAYQRLDLADPGSGEKAVDLLTELSSRKDAEAHRFFLGLYSHDPQDIRCDFKLSGRDTLHPNDAGATSRYLFEQEYVFKYFARTGEILNLEPLMARLARCPAILPLTVNYLIQIRKKMPPKAADCLKKLDYSREDPYFQAWLAYLKIRLFDLDVDQNAGKLRDVFAHSLQNPSLKGTGPYAPADVYFASFIQPVQYLALERRNEPMLRVMLELTRKADGWTAEELGDSLASIALADFDYFMKGACGCLSSREIDDLLESLAAVSMDVEAFKKKYAARLANPQDAYHHELLVVTGQTQSAKSR